MQEPGLDLHEWETRWTELQEQLEQAPAETLPSLVGLMRELLVDHGYQLDEPVTLEGEEHEIVAEFIAGREVAERLERFEEVDPGDVGAAVTGLRALYRLLNADRVGD